MEDGLYNQTLQFLKNNTLPNKFPSTKSNFKDTAGKYKINKKGFLTRNGKIVVRENMQLVILVLFFFSFYIRAKCIPLGRKQNF